MIEDKFRSIIPQYRRDPITKEIISQPRSEQITVSPVSPMYVTAELIDEYFRVIIQDMSSQYLIEVFNFDDISEGHFYVNYTSRKIYFDNASIGAKYNIYYNGMGGEFVDASLISTQIDMAGDVVQTLEDILKSESIGNINESWGRVTYIQPSNNILQLTKNRRQYVTNGTLLTGNIVKLPIMELGDYIQLTLMFYSDNVVSLVFEDDGTKWSNQPIIQAGRNYTFSFEYVDGTWYCEWVKLERYIKNYIYKAGDTCVAFTGGYSYSTPTSWSYARNENGRITLVAGDWNNGIPLTATTINNIDLTNYSKLYIDLDCHNPYEAQIRIGGVNVLSIGTTDRKTVIIDLSTITGEKSIQFYARRYNWDTTTLNVYNAWLEKEGFDNTTQEIFTTSEKTKLSSISANANKVIDSTINGNILIDGVETNVYYIQSGTTEQRPIPTLIGQAYFDTDLGKQINAKTLSPVVWVDGIGTVC